MTAITEANQQRQWPIWIQASALYVAFEFLDQLAKLVRVIELGEHGDLSSDLVLLATALIPAILLYGIFCRKPWARHGAITWFCCEVFFNLFVLAAAIMIGRTPMLSPKIIFEITGEIVVLVSCYHYGTFFSRAESSQLTSP